MKGLLRILNFSSMALYSLLVVACLLNSTILADQRQFPYEVRGTVEDSSGAGIPGAQVIFSGADFKSTQTTDNQGHFAFKEVPVTVATIKVRAYGFAGTEQKWQAEETGSSALEIRLTPAHLSESIAVTATLTRQRVSDTAENTTVLALDDLSTVAASTLDNTLRQVPGFVLFRRTSSLTSNPTAQGVSMRGTGSSGASRATVLEDGVPLNDPFGGWVYWDRVPRESIEAVEVVQGGMSDLYGTGALGGVINVIPHKPRKSSLFFETSFGNERTPNVSLFSCLRKGGWLAELSVEALRTDGYIPVNEQERGVVDIPSSSQHTTVNFTLSRLFSERARLFARGSTFQESRNNGTPLQTNQTHFRQISLGGDWQSVGWGAFQFRAFGGPQLYEQAFSAIAPDRDSETLSRLQRVPAQQVGGSFGWSRPLASRQTLVVGLEAGEERGTSDERVYIQSRPSSVVGAGGRQNNIGFHAEDIVRLSPAWMVSGAVRFDRWHNGDGLSATQPLARPGSGMVVAFPTRSEQIFSPRLGLVGHITDHLVVRASVYRAFRAPTLNELYRSFRLGNVVTLSNASLNAERLTGGEVGASYRIIGPQLTLRGTLFLSEINLPIANVTLETQPNLITRQRQNLGNTQQRGLELGFESYLTSAIILSGGYQWVDSKIRSFPANRSLENLLVPHVPRHSFTFQARYSNPRYLTLGWQGRFSGSEFDDDQNLLPLNRYFILDALVSRPFAHGTVLFVALENLLNQRCEVARTPVLSLGPPLLVRVGLRLRL